MTKQRQLKSFDLYIFGGNGDLAHRKIYPALYYRFADQQITKGSRITAIARAKIDQNTFLDKVKNSIIEQEPDADQNVLSGLLGLIDYKQVDASNEQDFKVLTKSRKQAKNSLNIYYLATPASVFGSICENLSKSKCIDKNSRIVLEKPLGSDYASSEAINEKVGQYFHENQIYRIDHYLGKETVQNLMVLRFANNIFESLWNENSISNVEITVSEDMGVSNRKAYYESYGALRDMVQNHILQLVCLVAMEPPAVLNADDVRNEKLKVLKALRPFTVENVEQNSIRAQYIRGNIGDEQVPAYLEDVEKYDSKTESFVALKVFIDNWRWAGVPFYLRTGKRLPKKYSEIIINFKKVPHNIFPLGEKIEANKLVIRLQPDERIELFQLVKKPGPGGYRYTPASLKLDYVDNFEQRFPEAYERLLMDVVRGNQTLFMRRDEVQEAWKWTETILKSWEETDLEMLNYRAGTWDACNTPLCKEINWHKPPAGI